MNPIQNNTTAQSYQVLIVEDNKDIVDLLEIHLTDKNCNISIAYDGLEGFQLAQKGNYDLIILDIMLPSMDGTEVCRQLRVNNNFTPILMLSAKSEKYDNILGLEYGADVYMTKPFRIPEFIHHIDNLLCKPSPCSDCSEELIQHQKEVLEYRDFKLHTQSKEVIVRDRKLNLSCKEFQILSLLASTPGKSYTRTDILELIWGSTIKGYEHTVNLHISRIRSKIELNLQSPNYILTSLGLGYRFNEELVA